MPSRTIIIVIIATLAIAAGLIWLKQAPETLQGAIAESAERPLTHPAQQRSDTPPSAAAINPLDDETLAESSGVQPVDEQLDDFDKTVILCGGELASQTDQEQQTYNNQMQAMAQSADSNHRLAYTIYHVANNLTSGLSNNEQDSLARIALLDELLAEQANLEMAQLRLLEYCPSYPNNPACQESRLQQLVFANRSNGAFWLQLAAYHLKANQHRQALEALSELTKAPYYDDGWGKRLTLFANIHQQLTGAHFGNSLVAALGVSAASNNQNFIDVLVWCNRTDGLSERTEACLALGQAWEEKGNTAVTQQAGTSIQRTIYENEHNTSALQALQQREQKRSNERFDFPSGHYATILLTANEKFARGWLDTIAKQGEQATTAYIKRAVADFAADARNAECLAAIEALHKLPPYDAEKLAPNN